MKKILFILIFTTSILQAQSGYYSLNIGAGYDLENREQAIVSFEVYNRYYNNWEFNLHYTRDKDYFINSEIIIDENTTETKRVNARFEELKFGFAYKPNLFKNSDFFLNGRFGGFAGTNYNKVILGPQIGLEASYYLLDNVIVFINQNNHFVVNSNERFRHGLMAGLKFQF